MFRTVFAIALALGLPILAPRHAVAAQSPNPAAAAGQVTSHFTVLVPVETTEIRMENALIMQPGTSREVDTRPLEAGRDYDYTFVLEWAPNNYTIMTRTRTVRFRAGDRVTVDLTVEQPSDRARIRWVTTPDEVVEAMIGLARITGNDVVFEPGCGDARITMAAVRAGARRGVGIDIDPALVTASQVRVKEAGLADRIDIRLGDALDVKDLSEASVVFLYMGDEFDMLLRPILWRDLKVGSRIVSHRFMFGDWQPDQTLDLVINDGYHYLVHLWTITPEIKARAAQQ